MNYKRKYQLALIVLTLNNFIFIINNQNVNEVIGCSLILAVSVSALIISFIE